MRNYDIDMISGRVSISDRIHDNVPICCGRGVAQYVRSIWLLV
jgi:hypothetical protein